MKISPEDLNIITDIDIYRVHVHNQFYLVRLPSLPLHFLDTFHTISDLESYRLISYNWSDPTYMTSSDDGIITPGCLEEDRKIINSS